MIQTNSLWARLITSANRLSWIDASKLQGVLNVSAHRGGGGFRVAGFKGIAILPSAQRTEQPLALRKSPRRDEARKLRVDRNGWTSAFRTTRL